MGLPFHWFLACDFSCQGMNTFKKHKNTRHQKVQEISDYSEKVHSEATPDIANNDSKSFENKSVSEGDIGLYEIELVNGVVVLVCNLCQEGFDMNDDIESHLKNIHNKKFGPNQWTSCLDRECGICNECGLKKYE